MKISNRKKKQCDVCASLRFSLRNCEPLWQIQCRSKFEGNMAEGKESFVTMLGWSEFNLVVSEARIIISYFDKQNLDIFFSLPMRS